MMGKQIFTISDLGWKVIVFYNPKYITEVLRTLEECGCADCHSGEIMQYMLRDELNSGCIYSNKSKKTSVIIIGRSSSLGQFMNTLVHEKNHLEMHICDALDIDPFSEEAAILSGDISQIMFDDALSTVIDSKYLW